MTFSSNKILLGLLCLIASTACGQIAGEARKFSVGVRVGGSLNWGSFGVKDQKDTFSIKPSLGFTAGALIIFPLKKRYTLVIEGAYARKSRTLKDKVLTNTAVYHFIDATLLLRQAYPFHFAKNVPGDFFVNIGPEVSYWLNGRGAISAQGPGYPYSIEFNRSPDGNKDYLYYNSANRWLFGLVLGVGFKAPLRRNQSIATELRFVSGHTYLGNKPYEYPVYEWYPVLNYKDTMQTNLKLISISATYTFDFNVLESRKGKSTLDKQIRRKR